MCDYGELLAICLIGFRLFEKLSTTCDTALLSLNLRRWIYALVLHFVKQMWRNKDKHLKQKYRHELTWPIAMSHIVTRRHALRTNHKIQNDTKGIYMDRWTSQHITYAPATSVLFLGYTGGSKISLKLNSLLLLPPFCYPVNNTALHVISSCAHAKPLALVK